MRLRSVPALPAVVNLPDDAGTFMLSDVRRALLNESFQFGWGACAKGLNVMKEHLAK